MDSYWKKTVISITAAGFCIILLMGRYELVGAGESAGVYRLDRWTGNVVFILYTTASEVEFDD